MKKSENFLNSPPLLIVKGEKVLKMNPRTFLSQIRKIEREIKIKKELFNSYEKLSLSVSSPTYGERTHFNPNTNIEAPFLKWIFKKDEIEKEILDLEETLKQIKDDALLQIETIKNIDLRMILIKHYLEGKTLEEIASMLYVSKATIKRYHRKALSLLNFSQLS